MKLKSFCISFLLRGSSQPRNWTWVSCISRWILYQWATESQTQLSNWTKCNLDTRRAQYREDYLAFWLVQVSSYKLVDRKPEKAKLSLLQQLFFSDNFHHLQLVKFLWDLGIWLGFWVSWYLIFVLLILSFKWKFEGFQMKVEVP